MPSQPLIVLKFGGSVLLDEDRTRIAVHEIYRWRRAGWAVVAVVSALAGRTDALLARCARVGTPVSPEIEAGVLSTGELEAAALLGLQLDRAGIPARVLGPGSARLVAGGAPLDAALESVDASVIADALAAEGVVVFPGFVAMDRRGRTVTLGRGGSDLTALFLARELDADRCRLVKDVDGLYVSDPAGAERPPARFRCASYADALGTDGSIVQHKAVRYAASLGVAFELGRFNGVDPTRIADAPSAFDADRDRPTPLTVALLGLGVVGRGTLELLHQLPRHFRVVGAAVRDPAKHAGCGLAPGLITTDAVALAASGADVVVEAMGGLEPARAAAAAALASGSDVVTANKALLARHGPALRDGADAHGRRLLASASVGGALPAIERVASAPVRSVRGVLNGTCNHVLDAVGRGAGFSDAVEQARRLGLAEADPSRDLDGRDSLDKLRVLAQTGRCGRDDARVLACEPVSPAGVGPRPGGVRIRQVARLDAGGLSVRLEGVGPGDAFHDLPGAWPAIEIDRADGTRELFRARGAGRWPTAESVVADLLELSRARSDAASRPLREAAHA